MVATLSPSNVMQNAKCSLSVLWKTSLPYNTPAPSSRTLILLFPPFWNDYDFILFIFLKLLHFYCNICECNHGDFGNMITTPFRVYFSSIVKVQTDLNISERCWSADVSRKLTHFPQGLSYPVDTEPGFCGILQSGQPLFFRCMSHPQTWVFGKRTKAAELPSGACVSICV